MFADVGLLRERVTEEEVDPGKRPPRESFVVLISSAVWSCGCGCGWWVDIDAEQTLSLFSVGGNQL